MVKYISTVLILILSFCGYAQVAWQEKLDEKLRLNLSNTMEFDVVIWLNQQANVTTSKFIKGKEEKGNYVFNQLHTTSLQTQSNLVQYLNQYNIPHQSFWVVNAIWAKLTQAELQAIASFSEVGQIVENANYEMLKPFELPNNAFSKDPTLEWGIQQIQADKVWEMGYRGQGVVVAGQDTGYEWEHEGIKTKYRGWNGVEADHNYNWHDAIHDYSDLHNSQINDCGLDVSIPCDDHNHGTHTIGTIVGETDEMQFGVAPAAKWIGCRNMERGYGTLQTYLECFQWFLAPTDLNNENPNPALSPHVINNSWGCPAMEGCNPSNFEVLETAVNNLKQSGIVVVVSAGNDGPDCATIQNPASIFESSFTVGALDQADTLIWFSSRGVVNADGSSRMKPNVVAPGTFVTSSIRGDNYATWAGTSMAGPHVAGLVALLISAQPELSGDVDRIESIIEQTAITHTMDAVCNGASGLDVPNPFYGYGAVNALNAVNYALSNPINIEDNGISIYPNPVQRTLNLNMQNLSGTATVQLYGSDGKFLTEETYDLSGGNKIRTVDMAEFPKGIYFYQLINGENTFQGKIVK